MKKSKTFFDSDVVIQTKNLSRKFGSFTAVDDLDLSVSKKSIYGFLGPNGCGKSTTIRMLCGLLSPTSGTANVLGFHMPQQAENLRTRIGYMTQKFSLYDDLTVQENLQFMGQVYSIPYRTIKARTSELLSMYRLDDLKNQRAGSMSGGQRQRLALAAATLHKPSLLFLDEPTSAVDPENRRDFWEKLFDLCDQGVTILVSTHYMDEAERCHRLAILDEGQLKAEGEPQQLMASMGANTIELASDNMSHIKSLVKKLPKVKSAAQQGLRLRVLIDRSEKNPIAYLSEHLQNSSIVYSEVHPSLEDVFVTVTGSKKAQVDK